MNSENRTRIYSMNDYIFYEIRLCLFTFTVNQRIIFLSTMETFAVDRLISNLDNKYSCRAINETSRQLSRHSIFFHLALKRLLMLVLYYFCSYLYSNLSFFLLFRNITGRNWIDMEIYRV